MKVLEPEVELLVERDKVSHIAKCARICYKRDKGNDLGTYDRLFNSKHFSMFRHSTSYYIVPIKDCPDFFINIYECIKHNQIIIGIDIEINNNLCFIVTNYNWEINNMYVSALLKNYNVDVYTFSKYNKEMIRYTFKVITQISTSRELNRVSPNNISEQSTRYVYEDGSIVRPHWMNDEEVIKINKDLLNESDTKLFNYINSCKNSFESYKIAIEKYNMSREDARGILPLDTTTVCCYTYSIKEWRNIIDLRYYETTGKPHPNAKYIANKIRHNLILCGHDFKK